MKFNTDLLDEYAENEGYEDWEILSQPKQYFGEVAKSLFHGDLIVRFIKEESNDEV